MKAREEAIIEIITDTGAAVSAPARLVLTASNKPPKKDSFSILGCESPGGHEIASALLLRERLAFALLGESSPDDPVARPVAALTMARLGVHSQGLCAKRPPRRWPRGSRQKRSR